MSHARLEVMMESLLATQEKVRELACRGGANLNFESLQALDHGIASGRGGIWLE